MPSKTVEVGLTTELDVNAVVIAEVDNAFVDVFEVARLAVANPQVYTVVVVVELTVAVETNEVAVPVMAVLSFTIVLILSVRDRPDLAYVVLTSWKKRSSRC